jgi:hypothetical protein
VLTQIAQGLLAERQQSQGQLLAAEEAAYQRALGIAATRRPTAAATVRLRPAARDLGRGLGGTGSGYDAPSANIGGVPNYGPGATGPGVSIADLLLRPRSSAF